jgi:tetratricopeptide (TPR) repeat protein
LGQAVDADDIWSADLQETMVEEPPAVRPQPSPQSHPSTPPTPSVSPPSSSRKTFRRSEIASWRSPWIPYAGIGLVTLALAGAAYYLIGGSPEPTPEEVPPVDEAAGPADPELLSTLSRARESLDAKDYSQAMILAQRILDTEPGHAEATEIYDEAAATLEQLNQSLDEARALLDSGQEEQAARSLAVALAIHPTHPLAVELSKELNRRLQEQAEATRRKMAQEEAERDRAVAAERAELEQTASQWERRLTAARDEETIQSQPAFQNAVTLESEAQRLADQGNYEGAAASYQQAMRRLDEAQESARKAEEARASEKLREVEAARAAKQLAARTESLPSPPPQPSPPPTTSVPVVEQETEAIRAVLTRWERAIETQDLALYRSVKPNLTGQDEERLRASFQAVDAQDVTISILTLELQGNRASVRLAREDRFVANGRSHNSSTEQMLVLSKEAGGWVIVEIGE